MILGTTRAIRAFAYPKPTDLRNGYNGLFGLVKTGLERDPLSGELFLFVNKRRNACKVLMWEVTIAVLHVPEAIANAPRSRCRFTRFAVSHSK